SVVAGRLLRRLRTGRVVPLPRRPQRRHQTVTTTHRRPDDGRLAAVERVWQQARWMGGWFLQLDAPERPVPGCQPRASRHRGNHVRARETDPQADGRGVLNMALEKYREKRNFKESPEPAGDTKIAAERRRTTKRRH